MSIPLLPRGQCMQCADCAAFVVVVFDPVQQATRPHDVPSSAHQTCSPCSHSWLAHEPPPMDPNDRNYLMQRGACARTGCSRFISPIARWETTTVCVCSASWHSHAPIILPAPASVAQLRSHTELPPLPLGGLGPPMHAFLGVSAPTQGSAGTRRLTSIGRSLPHGPFAAATANHSGPRRNFPGSAAPPSVKRPGDFEPPGFPAPRISIRNAQGKRYAEAFKDQGLYFSLDIPQNGPANVTEFTQGLTEQLRARDFSLPPCPDDTLQGVSSNDLAGQLWELLSSRASQDVYNFNVHPSVNDSTFGYNTFKKLQKPPNPLDTNNLWIFLAPRFGPLLGPVTAFSTPASPLSGSHPCFGWRFLDTLPPTHRSIRDDPLDTTCYEACPSHAPSIVPYLPPPPQTQQRTTTPPPQPLVRQRSPTSQNLSSDRRVRPRHEEEPSHVRSSIILKNVFSRLTESKPQAIEEDVQPPPPPRPPLAPLEVGKDILAPAAIIGWSRSVDQLMHPVDPDHRVRPVFIQGKTIHAIAACTLDLLIYVHMLADDPDATFNMEDPDLANQILRRSTSISLRSFFVPVRMYEIVSRSQDERRTSGGPGPERAVLREACTVVANRHNFWQCVPGSSMYRPILNPTGMALPSRMATFRAHGTFLAIHCFTLHHGPHPISIWVLRALIEGKSAMLIPKHILRHMDPEVFDILAPWYDWHQDTPVPSAQDPSHPLRVFVFEHMPSIQPNLISNNRTKEEHEGWLVSVFASLLLGHPDPWSHPEWGALLDGFNIVINLMHFSATIRSLGTLSFLVTLYDRRVKAVEDVSKHLYFTILSRASDSTSDLFAKLFEIRLQRYLKGVGHPPQLRALEVSEADYIADEDDPLLRTNLLLAAASDSDMCPMEETWGIHFRFYGRDTSDSVLGTPMGFHTCTYAVDIFLDRAMQDILVEPPTEVEHMFDGWPVRRPDSPISWAANPDEEESSSDSESLYALSQNGAENGVETLVVDLEEANVGQDSEVEVLDSPPALRQALPASRTRSSISMYESNALPLLTGLDFAAQVALLIAEVQRRQPSRRPPASTTPEADERQTPDIQRVRHDGRQKSIDQTTRDDKYDNRLVVISSLGPPLLRYLGTHMPHSREM
ncbi:hypothetical protein B0H11DRAFT_2254787 [Mycena galericulata]|nr:hypothetical protein B0H11DRAFT_2254787 [Mycena galericulata]